MPWRVTVLPRMSRREAAGVRNAIMRRSRFLLDESVDPFVGQFLRRHRWNVLDVAHAGIAGQPDENVLALAYREGRVLLTHDADFLDERRFPYSRSAGIVVLPGAEGDRRALGNAIGSMLAIVGSNHELWRQSRIRIAGDGTWTWRTFEPSEGVVVVQRWNARRPAVFERWED